MDLQTPAWRRRDSRWRLSLQSARPAACSARKSHRSGTENVAARGSSAKYIARSSRRPFRWECGILVRTSLIFACLPFAIANQPAFSADYQWNLPKGFPKPYVPADNPMSAAKVELGRYLFYDTRISVNGKQSCASCHKQELAFTDGRAVGVGATGNPTRAVQ